MFPQRHQQNIRKSDRFGRRPVPSPLNVRRNSFNQQVRRPFVPGTPVQSQRNNFLSIFQNEDGKWDFQKMSNTASQAMGVYKQVSSLSPLIMRMFGR